MLRYSTNSSLFFRASLVQPASMMLIHVAAFTVIMVAPASRARKPHCVCAHQALVALSVSTRLIAIVLPSPATMAVLAKAPQSHHTSTVCALRRSTACSATFWTTVSLAASVMTSLYRPWWPAARWLTVRLKRATSFATVPATAMSVSGMTVNAHSTSLIRGRTARLHCSAGATSTMASVINSVTMLAASMMGLTARKAVASASELQRAHTYLLGCVI